jgi:hypothetical protein
MTEPLNIILDFVEGRLEVEEFDRALRKDTKLKTFLTDTHLDWSNTYIKTTPYEYLCTLNLKSPVGALNAHGVVSLLLDHLGERYTPTLVYQDFFDLILAAQPKWLDVDPLFIKKHVLPEAGDLKGTALKKWLREKLKALFRYASKPPKWIQNPAWPLRENTPMVFLGEVKLRASEFFHDDGAAYVFYDPVSGKTETVIQLF